MFTYTRPYQCTSISVEDVKIFFRPLNKLFYRMALSLLSVLYIVYIKLFI